MIACNYFAFTRVSIFVTNEVFGTVALGELLNQAYCPWTILSTHTVPLGTVDFTAEIDIAKASGSSIFIILLDSTSGAALLEQGYNVGLFKEGVQIFGGSSITTPATWLKIKDQSKVTSIMKGFIGIQYKPSYSLRNTPEGKKFVQNFRKLKGVDGKSQCYIDNTIGNTPSCVNLNFSAFAADGSDIYPNAVHAYDAVYAIGYAIQYLFQGNIRHPLNLDDLHDLFTDITVTNFNGATGRIEFDLGSPVYPFEGKGNRHIGHTYTIHSFNADKFKENPSEGLNLVGKFVYPYTLICGDTSSSLLLDGQACEAIDYNTADGKPTKDLPPFTLSTPPSIVKLGGYFNIFEEDGTRDPLRAQSLAAFLMAVKEINANPTLLPNTQLVVGVKSGHNFEGAINTVADLKTEIFGGSGVDFMVSASDTTETQACNSMYHNFPMIILHTESTDDEMSNGALYPNKIQLTPLDSLQGKQTP